MMHKAACVIGHPIAHSRSPLIHGYWLQSYGIAGRYEREDVTPEAFPDFLKSLEDQGYSGANVTLPHKEAALELVDEADATARAVGAVNTVWIEQGRLYGSNTDVHGFLANLDDGAPGWDRRLDRAVILGAGGAARALVYGLQQRGAGSIDLVNRSLDRAQKLAADFGGTVRAHGWEQQAELLKSADLIVNATSLGMTGKPPLDIDLSAVPAHATVTDIVYSPLETGLLAAARERGLRVVDGLGMLLHQAVPGFEKWFGHRPAVTSGLRDRIVADLLAQAAS